MKTLTHYTATWCQPCKAMAPIIDKFIAENPDINYIKLDADKDTQHFLDNGITGVPTFVVDVDGEVLNRHTGVATSEKFAKLFDK